MAGAKLELWWEADKDRAADIVSSTVEDLASSQAKRDHYARHMHSVYEARDILALDASSYLSGLARSELAWPVVRRIVDTACVKIYSRSRPRPKFTTTGGDYRDRQKARGMEKFIEAQYRQTFGQYENLWELTEAVGKDAAKVGVGVVKVYAGETRLEAERINYLDLYVDEQESASGEVSNIFHRYPYQRAKLLALPGLSGGAKTAIKMAPPYEAKRSSGKKERRSSDMIEVTEAWRLPSGSTKGRHLICIQGENRKGGRTLVDEPWTRPTFPFAILRYEPDPFGYWATGLCYVLDQMQERLNRTTQDMSNNSRLMGSGTILAHEDAELGDQVATNEPWKKVIWKGTVRPDFATPAPFNPMMIGWVQDQKTTCYEMSGVNQSSASGKKEPGVTAAVAMREMTDIESENLKPYAVRYENFHVALGRLSVAAISELDKSKDGDSFKNWNGQGFLKSVEWADINLPESMYTTSVHAASSMPSTPFAKKQSIAEDFDMGLIDAQERGRRMKELDLEHYASVDNAQFELVENLITRYLFAEDKEHLEKLGGYQGPNEFYESYPRAIKQVKQAMLSEDIHGDLPEFNKGTLVRFIEDLDDFMVREEARKQLMLAEAQQREMAAKQPTGGPPGAGGPPTAMPGGPPTLPPQGAA